MASSKVKFMVLAFALGVHANADETSKEEIVNAKLISSSCIKPFYPKDSLLNREQGASLINLHVDLNGDVVEAKVQESSGFVALDEAAIKIFSSCKFSPATKNGEPVVSWKELKYVWKINEKS